MYVFPMYTMAIPLCFSFYCIKKSTAPTLKLSYREVNSECPILVGGDDLGGYSDVYVVRGNRRTRQIDNRDVCTFERRDRGADIAMKTISIALSLLKGTVSPALLLHTLSPL